MVARPGNKFNDKLTFRVKKLSQDGTEKKYSRILILKVTG